MQAPKGPFDIYIYNNTVFVREDLPARFAVVGTADGVLVANNIFYLTGGTEDVHGDQDTMAKWEVRANAMNRDPQRVFFENNLYPRKKIIPKTLKLQDDDPVIGDPEFRNPGGFRPEDYIPENKALIQNKGIKIRELRSSHVDSSFDLEVEVDFFGNPIRGKPDLGAIELPL